MKQLRLFAVGLVSLGLAAPVQAADFSDPTWPCIQRKVENLSIGLMWPHEIAEIKMTPELAEESDDLASSLALRRIDLDQANEYVTAFADTHGREAALMGHIFENVFNQLNSRRSLIISGIEDFSLKQIEMSERINTTRSEMQTLMAADEPDYDSVDRLEEQIDWEERIYTDRQKSLVYVCETPVLLEQRLYAIAQMLSDQIES